jgi:uncharacterized protein
MLLVIYIILGVLATVSLLTFGISFAFAKMYCKPKRKKSNQTPKDFGLQFDYVTFPSDEKLLKGWFMPGCDQESPLPAVVLSHSWGSNSAQMLELARILHEAGLIVLSYDTRGHGDSPDGGPITLRKYSQDISAAIDYLHSRPEVDTRYLAVVGHSMGAAASIVASSLDTRIKVAVSSSSFADPEDLTKGYMRRYFIPLWPNLFIVRKFLEKWLGSKMSDVAPMNRISLIRIPLLLIHGDSDKSILPHNMETLYNNSSKGLTECLLIHGRGHSDVIKDAEYFNNVVKFISRNLQLSEKESPAMVPQAEIP